MPRRPEGRTPDKIRPLTIETGFQRNAPGSVLIATGNTRVLCAASVEDRVPGWMRGEGRGWVTAEYAMLPGSGDSRIRRGPNSRGTEIQRLIGRSLRGVVDLKALDGYTITVDCDVLDADGGTRTAAVTGGWVALFLACRALMARKKLKRDPIRGQIAAVSVGIVKGVPLLDLDYLEDSSADVDMNVVATADGKLIEIQGTAEGEPFDRAGLNKLLDLAEVGIATLAAAQRAALDAA